MAATCPSGFNVDRLREQIRGMYTRLARSPEGDFHFHRGPRYAVERLGYDRAELAGLPAACAARFAGVGNPLRIGPLRAGETVLDHACGAGVDLLLAARRVGPGGRAIGVDMTPAMREQATAAAAEAGLAGIVERAGRAARGPAGGGRERRRRDLERRRQPVARQAAGLPGDRPGPAPGWAAVPGRRGGGARAEAGGARGPGAVGSLHRGRGS